MPFDRSFWEQLAAKAGLSKEAIEAVATNESMLKELNAGYLRQDEFSRNMDGTKAEKHAAEQAKSEAIAKYRENLEWYGKKEADLRLVDQYRARFGELTADGNGNGNGNGSGNGNGQGTTITSPTAFTREQAQELVRGAQRESYTLNKEILKADREYQKRFGEPLPIEELEQVALKPENAGRNLKDVYADWVAPKLAEKQNTEFEAKLKAAREEGYKDGMSKGRMREPSQSSPDEFNPMYGPRPKPEEKLDDGTLQRHFVETFDKGMEAERASTA